MTGNLNGLPRPEIPKDLFLDLNSLPFQSPQLLLLLRSQRSAFQFGNPVFNLIDRFFKRESMQAASHDGDLLGEHGASCENRRTSHTSILPSAGRLSQFEFQLCVSDSAFEEADRS